MSSEKLNKIDSEYNTYNDLIYNRLEEKGLSQKWLLKNIIKEGQNKESLQAQISRWFGRNKKVRDENPVSDYYKNIVNNALDIEVKQNSDGKWVITRTEKDSDGIVTEEPSIFNGGKSVKETGDRLKKAIDQQGFPDIARAFLVEYFRERQENLSKELKRVDDLLEKLLSHSDD